MRPRELFAYFDLGNVLVHFEHQKAVDQLAKLASRPTNLVREVAFDSGLEDRFETGLIDADQYCAELNLGLETQLETPDVLEAMSAIFELNESILPILEYLKANAIPMAVLSNTCSAHWNWISKQAWSIPGSWFEFAILSFEVHSMKPDSKIYAVSESRSGRDAKDLFFTDDRSENIAAAQDRGWTTHLFQSSAELEPAIRDWAEGDN